MERGENQESPRFCIENVPRGGRKLAVLQLHHGATLRSAVEDTVDLHWSVCFNKIFGKVNIFRTLLSKKDTFFIFHNFSFYKIH
jgi:hypothetical protein